MANTLTGLIPDFYLALETVNREMVGFIPSVSINAEASRVAVGQATRIPVVGASVASDISPSMTVGEPTDLATSYRDMTVTKSRRASFGYTGEEAKALNNGGNFATVQSQAISQAIRTLVNEIEADLATEYKVSSRAIGIAGTTAFASGLDDSAELVKIFVDNGSPTTDKHLIISTTAGVNLRKSTISIKADEAGTTSFRDNGTLLKPHGFNIRESAQINTHTKGTASSSTTDNVGYSKGDTVITLESAGTGTIVAGDIVTFAGDSNKYVVASGNTDVSDGGTITLGSPGLRQDISASATAITVGNNYEANMAFDRGAIQLLTRLPALPSGGRDAAIDRITLTDPYSGISFDLAHYVGDHKEKFEISVAWGQEVIKPENTALLLG